MKVMRREETKPDLPWDLDCACVGFSHNSRHLHFNGALFVGHHRHLQEGGLGREGGREGACMS